jgi:hypothetical protein
MTDTPEGKIADQGRGRPVQDPLRHGGTPGHALLRSIGHTVCDTGAYFMATRQLRSVSIGREIGAS